MTRLESFVRKITKGRFLQANIEAAGLPTRPRIDPNGISAPEIERVNRRIAGGLYESSPALRTCVDRIAERAKQVPLKAYKRPTKTQDWTEDDGPLGRLMGWFNPDDGPAAYLEKCVKYLVVYQRLYVGVEDNELPNRAIYPKNFYPLNPAYLDKVPDETGGHYYKYDPGGADPPKVYLSHEIIKCEPGISLNDTFHGSNPLSAAIGDIQQERYNREYVNRFLSRKMPITGVINIADAVNDEQLLTYELQLNAQTSTSKVGILALKKEDKYTPVQTDQAGIQAASIQSNSVTTIQWLYGVPLPILTGDSKDLEAVEEAFWSGTILPVLLLIAEAHDKWVQTNPQLGSKYRIGADISKVFALKRALVNLVKVAVAMVATGQATPNEGRALCGMGPLAKGSYDELDDWPNMLVPPMTAKMTTQNAIAQASAQAGVKDNDRGNAGSYGGASPSMSTPGQGDRDQGKDGEAQMVDTSGKKSITADMVESYFSIDSFTAKAIVDEIAMEGFLSGR